MREAIADFIELIKMLKCLWPVTNDKVGLISDFIFAPSKIESRYRIEQEFQGKLEDMFNN